MITGSLEKLEIGKIYNNYLISDSTISPELHKQPFKVIDEVTKQDWEYDKKEWIDQNPLLAKYWLQLLKYFYVVSLD